MTADPRYSEGYFERAEGSNYLNYSDDPRWVPIVEQIEYPDANRGLTILDVGAAKGWFVHHANLRGHEALGIDISEYAVQNCAPLAKGALVCADAADGLPYSTGMFDVVASWEFFEHITEDNIPGILSEMLRVLKDSGELWMRIALSDGASAHDDADATHVTMRTREWWEKKIAELHPELLPIHRSEVAMDEAFDGTDWVGRFFIYRKHKTAPLKP